MHLNGAGANHVQVTGAGVNHVQVTGAVAFPRRSTVDGAYSVHVNVAVAVPG